MELIKVGSIVNTFGIKGELKVLSLTDFANERFKSGQKLFVKINDNYQQLTVKTKREHKGFLLVLFENYQDINLVEKFKECDLYIDKNDIKDLDDGYYFFQLKDCDVYYQNEKIGIIISVESGYQTILRVLTKKGEILIPYVPAFIKNVDLSRNRVDAELIEGML